jgi:CTP:molybdopterin cytidylyltransferase MocA
MPPLSEIAAIILAAGLSSRFQAGPEETKLVVPLCDKPLVRHVAEAALASRARPILVVTGHATAQVEAALKNRDLSFISNPNYRTGLASSLKAGIAALPETAAGALILLADMPCVSVSLIDRLIQAFEESLSTLDALVAVTPAFLSYALSFVYVAIYWNNHHHFFHLVRYVSGMMQWAKMHLLFWLSLIPFATRCGLDFLAWLLRSGDRLDRAGWRLKTPHSAPRADARADQSQLLSQIGRRTAESACARDTLPAIPQQRKTGSR